jgi:hypothetical protein
LFFTFSKTFCLAVHLLFEGAHLPQLFNNLLLLGLDLNSNIAHGLTVQSKVHKDHCMYGTYRGCCNCRKADKNFKKKLLKTVFSFFIYAAKYNMLNLVADGCTSYLLA